MIRRYRATWHVTLALLLTVMGAGRAAAKWPARRVGSDLVIQTPHYVVESDHPEENVQLIAAQQEVLFAELHRRMNKIKPVSMRDRLKVLVYKDQERYLSRLGAGVAGSRGVFMPAMDVLACWADPDQLDIVLETLRHEGTHQFIAHYLGSNCPIWLNEGMAVFYEHGEFSRKSGRLVIGQVPKGRVNVLRKALAGGNIIPLSSMLMRTNQQWLERVNTRHPEGYLQYCQAWAMVHFLAYGGGGRYQPAFLQYMHYVSRGRPSTWAWERSFGNDFQGFQKVWEAYIKDLKPTGDTSACRRNLQVLGWLAVVAWKNHPDLVADMATFRKALLAGDFGAWSVSSGEWAIDGTDAKAVAQLFVCGEDPARRPTCSYTLVPGKEGTPPVLRCTHHTGKALESVPPKKIPDEPKVSDVSVRTLEAD